MITGRKLKQNLIALQRMVGRTGIVVFQGDSGAVTRKIVSDTLTITNPDGVDGDIRIEGSGGGGASVIDSIADGDTTNAPSRNAVFDALAGKAALSHTHAAADLPAVTGTIGCSFDGNSNVIVVNSFCDVYIPYGCTIDSYTILADRSGVISVDVRKDTYASYPPTSGDSITAGNPITVASGIKNTDSTLTGWSKTIAAGSTIRFVVATISLIRQVHITLNVTRT